MIVLSNLFLYLKLNLIANKIGKISSNTARKILLLLRLKGLFKVHLFMKNLLASTLFGQDDTKVTLLNLLTKSTSSVI